MSQFFTSLWDNFFPIKEARILMLGLENSGKTTLLYKLKLGELVATIPTNGFNVEQIFYRNYNSIIWDIGGGRNIRKIWKHYYQNTVGVIFVIDSYDRDKIDLARKHLTKIINEELLENVPILVFANKQDLPNASSCDELYGLLQLAKGKKVHIQGCCAIVGDGLYEGLDWLLEAMN